MTNRAPAPGNDSTAIAPPWPSTMPRASASPSPVPSPSGLVVKNGSKTRSNFARNSRPVLADLDPHSLVLRVVARPETQAAWRGG
jgi:hypothetical protein